ncbi:hypothetical protein DW998_14320, partial [Parabacteroides distasonis]
GRDCNGFTDYRHFNQNPCNSILSLYLSAFHFFVVTLLRKVTTLLFHTRFTYITILLQTSCLIIQGRIYIK